MRDSGTMFRKGDCSSWEARACLSVPSKPGSPVVLTNSVRRMESFSVSALVRRVKPKPAATAAIKTAAMHAHSHFLEPETAALVADAALIALDPTAAET